MLGSVLGCMLDGGVADAEEWGGSRCAGLRRSKGTVVEQP